MRKNLVLLGMMGVGKSTLGKIVAQKLNLEFIDTDAKIEEKCLMKIPTIFKKKGEKFFRLEEEKEVLESLKKNNCVIALGGGAFINTNSKANNKILECIKTINEFKVDSNVGDYDNTVYKMMNYMKITYLYYR